MKEVLNTKVNVDKKVDYKKNLADTKAMIDKNRTIPKEWM
jgi:hypothetical protein